MSYNGVSYYKAGKLWVARVRGSGLSEHIGYYDTEEEAAQAWNAHMEGTGVKLNVIPGKGTLSTWPKRHGEKRVPKSRYRGVSPRPNGWMALLTVKGRRIYLGDFGDELSAAKAYNEACETHGVPSRKNELEE